MHSCVLARFCLLRRRCCLGQVVLRCCSLRQALVDLGGDGSEGELVLELVAGVGEGGAEQGLRAALSQPMLQRALQMEADCVVSIMQQQQQQQQQRR
jgi:hypothetical protein